MQTEELISSKPSAWGYGSHAGMLALLIAGYWIVPNSYDLFNLELLGLYIITALGMNLLLNTGLISAGQAGIFGFSAYFVAIATVKGHWPFGLAMVAAIVATGLLAVVLGLPGLRLGPFTYAIITLGYGLIVPELATQWTFTGGGVGLTGIGFPALFSSLNSYYWLIAGMVLVAYVVHHNLLRSPMGRVTKAASEQPIAAQALGVSVYRTRLSGFVVSCLFAAAAGGLYGPLIALVAPSSFSTQLSILFLLMVLVGGRSTLVGPVVGAALLFWLPLEITTITSQPGEWSLLVYGAILIVIVWLIPEGLVSAFLTVGRALGGSRLLRRPAAVARRASTAGGTGRATPPVRLEEIAFNVVRASGHALDARELRKKLGGLEVLSGIDLTVEPGQIHALIGPNGSGKTTALNVLSGFVGLDRGEVELAGAAVTSMSPARRAMLHLARTFQTPLLFEKMTCLENVLVGFDAKRRVSWVAYLLRLPAARREERENVARAVALLSVFGLTGRSGTVASELTSGERRLLELARALAQEPSLVLMDEPAAGLNSTEIVELEAVLRRLKESGVAILLVEHHSDLVMRLADEVTVLDFGKVIAHGAAQDVQHDPKVIEAYFGTPMTPVEEGATARPEP